MSLSYFELLGKNCYDLLNDNQVVRLLEGPHGGTVTQGLTQVPRHTLPKRNGFPLPNSMLYCGWILVVERLGFGCISNHRNHKHHHFAQYQAT